MPSIFQGNYLVKRRSMLAFNQADDSPLNALNDLVKAGANGRLSRFSVSAGGERVADYACDGIVFSTPTGSTAYNLAAGGPIVHPDADVMLMTPISAHTLTSRSVVFPAGVSLSVSPVSGCEEPMVLLMVSPHWRKALIFLYKYRLPICPFPYWRKKTIHIFAYCEISSNGDECVNDRLNYHAFLRYSIGPNRVSRWLSDGSCGQSYECELY